MPATMPVPSATFRQRCSASRGNFVALQTLSHIAEAQADWKGALAAWQKVLELDPRTPDGQERLQMLRRRALGEST